MGTRSLTRGGVLLAYAAWCALVLWAVGDALRYSDEPDYLNGALQLDDGEVSPWRAAFFNYDKEYGSYWFLAFVLRISYFRSVIFSSNLAQAVVFCIAVGMILIFRYKNLTPVLLSAFVLSPVFVLYVPFFGTCTISFAFLIAGIALMSRGNRLRRSLAYLLIALAAMCRADVVLVMPMLILTELSRRRLPRLLGSPVALLSMMASVLPPLVGLLLTPARVETFQTSLPYGFLPIVPFITFGLGLAAFGLLAWSSGFFAAMAGRKPAWWLYYGLRALSPIIPFAFYVYQLATPQHFLLTLACYLIAITDRRAGLTFRWLRPAFDRSGLRRACVLLIVIGPWLIGVRAPSLAKIRPTVGPPAVFPASHGRFPMGAYGFYLIHGRQSGYVLDHNEKIFVAAENARYDACGGSVPVLRTPMVNYLLLALRLKGMSSVIVNDPRETGCGYAYADARSLLRNDLDLPPYSDIGPGRSGDLVRRAAIVASYEGQAILRLGLATTDLGTVLRAVHDRLPGRDVEIDTHAANADFDLGDVADGGMVYALSDGDCAVNPQAAGTEIIDADGKRLYFWTVSAGQSGRAVQVGCREGSLAGEVRLTLPRWMGR